MFVRPASAWKQKSLSILDWESIPGFLLWSSPCEGIIMRAIKMYRPRDGSSSFALNRQYWSFLPAAHYINIPFMLYITIGFGGIASFYLSPQNNDLIKKYQRILQESDGCYPAFNSLMFNCKKGYNQWPPNTQGKAGTSLLHQQINSCFLKLLMIKC